MAERFEFTPEQLEDRFADHYALAQSYVEALKSEFNVDARVSERRLYLTIISAYKDIERYKNFHLDDPFRQRSDAIKRAAYLAKWLCRFKPITVMDAGELSDLTNTDVDKATLVNELFALHLASVHISVDIQKDFVIAEEKAYEIAYEMLFRNLNEDSYLLVFQMIRDHITQKPLVITY